MAKGNSKNLGSPRRGKTTTPPRISKAAVNGQNVIRINPCPAILKPRRHQTETLLTSHTVRLYKTLSPGRFERPNKNHDRLSDPRAAHRVLRWGAGHDPC